MLEVLGSIIGGIIMVLVVGEMVLNALTGRSSKRHPGDEPGGDF